MEIFKAKNPCLTLLLLIVHTPFLHPGEALSPAVTTEESTPQQQAPAGLPQNSKSTAILAFPPLPNPATYKNPSFGLSLNNQGQQSQAVLPPQQGLNQPLSGFAQPLANTIQPFLGVNQEPFSSFNQPLGTSNQQDLVADNTNTPLDRGVSKKNSFTMAFALTSLLAYLGFTF